MFHLTVAGLALTLLAVSVGTIVYQHDPSWFHRLVEKGATLQSTNSAKPRKPIWNLGVSNTTANTNSTKGNPANTSRQSNSQSGTAGSQSDLALIPTYKETKNSILISVKPSEAGVSASEVDHVQKLLSKYQIVHRVSQTLRMNIYQEIYIVLAMTPSQYQQELSRLGVSTNQAHAFTLDTGGFTQGDTVVIPLYQNKNDADLANTLGHELTHAFLNVNVGSFPSWMNEGLAVTDGMAIQSAAENSVVYGGYARQMAESIVDVAKNGTIWPLATDEQKVLSGTAPYDLELQDWLAVRDLILRNGLQAFTDYFYRLNLGESESTAFRRSFGQTEAEFNNSLTAQLKVVGQAENDGLTLNIQIPASFVGDIRFLQHGVQNWTGFHATPGMSQVHIGVDGHLTGVKQTTAAIEDSNPPDSTTLYVNLDPIQPFTYQGAKVQNCGFAIDYHDGLYGFVNAWITIAGGKSVYLQNPTLFGVTIQNISEDTADGWLLSLFAPPTAGG